MHIDGVGLTCGVLAKPATLDVHGRRIEIRKPPWAWRDSIPGLCERPRRQRYRHRRRFTVIVENVPRMTPNRRDAARRFITFVDTLYDKRAGLVSAEAEPDGLYPRGEARVISERTVSRLMEMRSSRTWQTSGAAV
jgi:cell division protein ZapE